MYLFKKICLYTCIILLIISLYNDFKKGSYSFIETNENNELVSIKDLTVIKVKINAGDTVLSVSERINTNKITELNIDDVISDFSIVNPDADIHALTTNMYYYFPVYY